MDYKIIIFYFVSFVICFNCIYVKGEDGKGIEGLNEEVAALLRELNTEPKFPVVLKPLRYFDTKSGRDNTNANTRESNARPGFLRSKVTVGQGRNNDLDLIGLGEDGVVFSRTETMKRRLNSFRIAKLFPDVHPSAPRVRDVYFPENVTETPTTTEAIITTTVAPNPIPPIESTTANPETTGSFFSKWLNWWPFNKNKAEENITEIPSTTTITSTTTVQPTTSPMTMDRLRYIQPVGIFQYIPIATTPTTTNTTIKITNTISTNAGTTSIHLQPEPLGIYKFVPVSTVKEESTTQAPDTTTLESIGKQPVQSKGVYRFVPVAQGLNEVPSPTTAVTTTTTPGNTTMQHVAEEVQPIVSPQGATTPAHIESQPPGALRFVPVSATVPIESTTSTTTPSTATTLQPLEINKGIILEFVSTSQKRETLPTDANQVQPEATILPSTTELSTTTNTARPLAVRFVQSDSAPSQTQNALRFANFPSLKFPAVEDTFDPVPVFSPYRMIHPPPNIQSQRYSNQLQQPRPKFNQPPLPLLAQRQPSLLPNKPTPMKFRFENPNKKAREEKSEAEEKTIRRLPDGSIVLPNGIVVPPGFKCPLAKDE